MRHKPEIITLDLLELNWKGFDNYGYFQEWEYGGNSPIWVVVWPEHVQFPKYNGDATYFPYDNVEKAMSEYPNAKCLCENP